MSGGSCEHVGKRRLVCPLFTSLLQAEAGEYAEDPGGLARIAWCYMKIQMERDEEVTRTTSSMLDIAAGGMGKLNAEVRISAFVLP